MRRFAYAIAVVALTGLTPRGSSAQSPRAPSPDTLPRPAANPADVSSPDALLAALYDVISGGAGVKRDWNRFRSLFVPHARLIPTRARPSGGAEAGVMGVEDYVAAAGPGLERNGFFEREIFRVTEAYGSILHAFSTYESRRTADLAERPFARGINSIQVLKDGGRWWVVSIFWDAERPGNEIPEKYLRRGGGGA
jgi:hypothetical protein